MLLLDLKVGAVDLAQFGVFESGFAGMFEGIPDLDVARGETPNHRSIGKFHQNQPAGYFLLCDQLVEQRPPLMARKWVVFGYSVI